MSAGDASGVCFDLLPSYEMKREEINCGIAPPPDFLLGCQFSAQAIVLQRFILNTLKYHFLGLADSLFLHERFALLNQLMVVSKGRQPWEWWFITCCAGV